MKSRRLSHAYRKNASRLHRAVGDALLNKESPFKNYKVYQEYPVNRINPDYQDGRHKFDWVILDLRLVIEVHGEQHFKPVDFGGEGSDKAEENWRDTQFRDTKKKRAAVDVITAPLHPNIKPAHTIGTRYNILSNACLSSPILVKT